MSGGAAATGPTAVARSRHLVVDGIRTHFLEAGEGPAVVLLHSGEFGGSATLCWEPTIPALGAAGYRVVAPDWLGFGGTDKLHDFNGGQARRLWHMGRFLETLALERAAFVGSSMGGTLLARMAAEAGGAAAAAAAGAPWPIAAAVLASGGGFMPFNDARRTLVEFDGSLDAMREVVRVLFHDPRFAKDDALVERRHAASLEPGAWEASAAARLKSPAVPARGDFGVPDTVAYEQIAVPTLIVAGADDPLREPGYADGLHVRIAGSELHVLERCGHLPQLEQPALFNRLLLDFLGRRFVPAAG